MNYWQGKSVLITGASSGIGAELARQLAALGAKVGLGARRKDNLETLSTQIKAEGGQALSLELDVTDRKNCSDAVTEFIKHFDQLDCVIANAGFGVSGRFENLSSDDYQRQFNTNIFGVIHTLQTALPELKKAKGQAVIIGSVNSYVSLPGTSAYGMSKFAVRALAQSLTHELKDDGITTTLICPGFVESEIRQVNNKGVFNPKAKDVAPKGLVVSTKKAVAAMIHSIEKRKREVVITNHGKIIVWLERHIPWFVQFLLKRLKMPKR